MSNAMLAQPTHGSRRSRHRAEVKSRRLKRLLIWIPILLVVLVLAAGAAIVALLAPKGLAVKDSLEQAIPLANQAKEQILAGDAEAAQATATKLAALTGEARAETDDGLWKNLEWVPVVGPNLHAVRVAAESVDELVVRAITPVTNFSLESLKPQDGRINVEVLQEMQGVVADVQKTLDTVNAEMAAIDRDALIEQVSGGIEKLDEALLQVNGLIEPANEVLAVLPGALGAEEPRNYLVMFQNNAESRGTGGNPAALVVLRADNGALSIEQSASSSDFNNGRPQMITEVNPETVALYGDKIGRWMQDVTLTPDFTETVDIMLAFWEDTFNTPIDGVVSFDPVALSYLLEVTGPVELEFGQTLTAENAVSLLLNEVYAIYPDPEVQDLFFASAAGAAFGALTSGSGDMEALLDAVTRAVDEGRLMYAPATEDEAELIAGTRIEGKLASDNAEETQVGVYVNDITEGKLNYYMDLAIAAESTQCSADPATFTVSTDITSVLQPDEVWGLARYISPGRFFPKGHISTDLVVYGPVGSTFESATVDGSAVKAKALPHLGRPAVKINVINTPATSHNVTVNFTGAESGEFAEYGPLEVRHTPMVRETPVAISAPGCD